MDDDDKLPFSIAYEKNTSFDILFDHWVTFGLEPGISA
jgi:hypothetical protein